MAVLAVVLIWESKRKYLAIPFMMLGIYVALGALPEQWFGRMNTIETYEADTSAMERIEAWGDGYQYALDHPLLGAGFEGWSYVTQRDWHSSYIEILAEHGFLAFAMWFSLLFGTIISLTRLITKTRRFPEMAWVKNYATMLRASLIAYATGTIFLGCPPGKLFHQISVNMVKKISQ